MVSLKWVFILGGVIGWGCAATAPLVEESDETSSSTPKNTDPTDNMTEPECDSKVDYHTLGINCYVDNRLGDDAHSGFTAADPVHSQSAVDESCVVVRFKRGTVFNETLHLHDNVQVYTHYGNEKQSLPRFQVPRRLGSGPVVDGRDISGITLDGLFFSGAASNGAVEHVEEGICVVLGKESALLNSEITACDVGVMALGDGVRLQGNHIHDISRILKPNNLDTEMSSTSQCVWIRGSNIEVAYNTFENCSMPTHIFGGKVVCDGGAVDLLADPCQKTSDVRVHHNFARNTCGFAFFQAQDKTCGGGFEDYGIYHNVMVDSAWMGLIITEQTSLSGIHFYHNTLVHRQGAIYPGDYWGTRVTYNSDEPGELRPGTVEWTNNLLVMDGWTEEDGAQRTQGVAMSSNLFIKYESSFSSPVFFNFSGNASNDFSLVSGSPAIDQGERMPDAQLDFVHHVIPDESGMPDVGAFEYRSTKGTCPLPI